MKMKAILTTVLLLAWSIPSISSFNLPNIFKPPSLSIQTANNAAKNAEAQLIAAISNTANGKNADIETQSRVLKLVRNLETTYPTSPTLLSDPEESKILDGDWYLQYTQPSEIENADSGDKWVPSAASEGEPNIETTKFKAAGSISGAGIPVDASKNIPKQSFDIVNSRVKNEIRTAIGQITVAGRFRQSNAVPQRAVLASDTAKIELNIGPTLDISFLFRVIAALKGTDEGGWLETTYCSNDVRIGRGSKGSLFVLTRDIKAVKN